MKLVILYITLCVSIGAHPAWAQPADSEKVAHAHFKQGKAYLDAGVYDDAIKELEAGYKLSAQPEFMFNIGQAYRLAGNKVAAKQAYQKYVELAPEGDLADQARVFIATLTKQISDDAKASEQANKKAAADALAKRQVIDVTKTEHVQLDSARKSHDDAREAQQGRRTLGKWLVAIGITVMVGGGVAIAGDQGDAGVLVSVAAGVSGVGLLVFGIVKIRANPDLGVYVAPVASGDAKGLAIGWSF